MSHFTWSITTCAIGYCFGQGKFRTRLSSQKFLFVSADLKPIEELMYFKAFGEVDSPIFYGRVFVLVEEF